MKEDVKNMSKEELSSIMFMQYIYMMISACMQHLGKIANPVTGKTEKSLESAQAIIELLTMLRDKTKGNLNKDEESMLTDGLANLQLNYADEVNKPQEPDKEEKK